MYIEKNFIEIIFIDVSILWKLFLSFFFLWIYEIIIILWTEHSMLWTLPALSSSKAKQKTNANFWLITFFAVSSAAITLIFSVSYRYLKKKNVFESNVAELIFFLRWKSRKCWNKTTNQPNQYYLLVLEYKHRTYQRLWQRQHLEDLKEGHTTWDHTMDAC